MSSHHFNGQCCYLHQIIFQSHNNCLITKLFQGGFVCHDITKLLKLAQNDMVLFYFFFKMFWCALQTSLHPLLHPQQEHWHSPSPSSPQCWHLQLVPMQARGIVYAWQLISRLFFPKMLAALSLKCVKPQQDSEVCAGACLGRPMACGYVR